VTDPTPETRFPSIDRAGLRMLRWLTEHPAAPRFTHLATERLSPPALDRIAAYELGLTEPAGAGHDWLPGFIERCYRLVPRFRARGAPPASLAEVPSINRADLAGEPWAFVPDDAPLDEAMAVYQTSGSTGHPLNVPADAEALAKYVPLMRAALRGFGVGLKGGPDRVAIGVIGYQASTWTYASVAQYLGMAGCVKINLNPADWRDQGDRIAYLEALNPEILTGDPLAFDALADLPVKLQPKALISTAMTLLAGLRDRLEARFGCPVVDLYSMNESGPLAVRDETGEFHWLRPDIHLEILGTDDLPAGPGERGEITLTGGHNPYLPLLRYRTGDFGRAQQSPDGLRIIGLEGRPPTRFRVTGGRLVNPIDISIALKPFLLSQYALHQSADGSFTLRARGAREDVALRGALLAVLGADAQLAISPLDTLPPNAKVIQYTSDLF